MDTKQKSIMHYEKEINQMKKEGLSYRQIGEELGYTKMQVKYFARIIHMTA